MRSNWFVEYKLAHRGLHNDIYPENSLGAYENAIKHGFAIELDIRVLKDGNLAIFHDDNLNRMCGVNIAHSGIFSSDRTIEQYATGIWGSEIIYKNL